jgi:hypothetical protein
MNDPTIRQYTIIASLVTVVIITSAFILAHQDFVVAAFPQHYQKGNHTFGAISSIQNDERGKPAWIISGKWKSSLLNDQSSNASQGLGNSTSPFSRSPFDAQIEMVRLNGTAGHTHTITNFVLTTKSQPNNMTKAFNGTSTASMREGPATDIPTTIKITGDKVLSVWLDPSRIDNHFGNTPIYGLVIDDDITRPGSLNGNNTQMGK